MLGAVGNGSVAEPKRRSRQHCRLVGKDGARRGFRSRREPTGRPAPESGTRPTDSSLSFVRRLAKTSGRVGLGGRQSRKGDRAMRFMSYLVTGGIVEVSSAQAAEHKIDRSDLPAAVERTVSEQSVGATVRGLSREREDRVTFYEVELVVGERTKDVLIDTAG